MLRTALLAGSLALLAACQTAPPEMTDTERSAIEAAVTEELQTFIDAANAREVISGIWMRSFSAVRSLGGSKGEASVPAGAWPAELVWVAQPATR